MAAALAACMPAASMEPIDLVDPFIGTGGHGHTFPGATVPFGMVQLSPDTRLDGWDGCSGYHYTDEVIYGFSHTHLSGTGVSDYGDLLMMPCTGPVHFDNGHPNSPENGYASRFRKKSEKASPGYYAVHLQDYRIDAELTASPRCGVHRYSLPKGDFHIIIDLEHRDPLLSHSLQQTGPNEVSGHRISTQWAREQHFYFVVQFSEPIAAYLPAGTSVLRSARVHQGNTAYGRIETKAAISFAPVKQLIAKVGVSAVSIAQARANLEAEVPHFDFDRVHREAREAWQQQLNAVTLKGGTRNEQRIFYTALYHCMVAPNLWSDTDGSYRGMDGQVHRANHPVYTVFSLWDTFRALHPWFALTQGERNNHFLRTFLLHYTQGGRLPVWELAANETDCMIGYHSTSVVADAFAKGHTDFDTDAMLEAMVHSANLDHFGLESYKTHGYVRAEDEHESVSKTLEYAYNDWCISTYAKALGRDSIAHVFMQRAQYYKNLFDPTTGFFRARMDGAWFTPFDPYEVNFNYTEANAWQYSAFVPHDISGLTSLHGGTDAFAAHLDALFAARTETTGRDQADITGLIGQYAQGNEPSHHMAYLYNYTGHAPRTQRMVRRIMRELYTSAPDGLSGNEDCGQMSAWYVFSALGFYPVTPGSASYAIGSPLFDKASIALPNGRTFTIEAPGNGPKQPYIQHTTLNGREWPYSYLPHDSVAAGGTLVLHMGASPSGKWGNNHEHRPRTAIAAPAIVPVPGFLVEAPTFGESTTVQITHPIAAHRVWYRKDGGAAELYKGPVAVHTTTRLEAWAQDEQGATSTVNEKTLYRLDNRRKVQLHTEFAPQYSAGGLNALIDRLRGSANYLTGRWQGYHGQDFHAVVDLGQIVQAQRVGVGFLQSAKSWIWLPPEVRIETSANGSTWSASQPIKHLVPDTAEGTLVHDFVAQVAAPVRYIRVQAPYYGPCPPWHPGAGGTSWLFADEIWVEEAPMP